MRTLPWGPIEPWIAHISDGAVADLAGIDRTSIVKWRTQGSLPLFQADRLACAIGLHPANVWPAFDPRHVR